MSYNAGESESGSPLGDAQGAATQPLLGPDDPPPFQVLNPNGSARLLLVCDHASRRIPQSLDALGLDELALSRHIACDIGAAAATHYLSEELDAPAVLAGYSRLVIDPNRHPKDPTSIPAVSDGDFVPGNHLVSLSEKLRRKRALFDPYHEEVTRWIGLFQDRGIVPAFVAIHSFTPFFDDKHRPWEIGVLWDSDGRIPVPLMDEMRRRGVCVGDNEPYSGRAPSDYTIDHHAEPAGLPHASIELRQDLLMAPGGVNRWAGILCDSMKGILADDSLYRVLE